MNDSGRNQAVIGAFVVGAVALVVVGVMVFSGGRLFRQTERFVMYFDGSVKGLNVGAPVTFRGVKIGSVVDIALRVNPENMEFHIPVVIEVEKNRIERTAETPVRGPEAIKRLIDKGLRAKLDLQSIITGQLLINLEMLPDEPKHLSGVRHRYPEIPTVPTTYERLAKKLENLPIEEIINDASASMKALKALLNTPALPEMISRLNQVSANLQELSANLNHRADPLADSFEQIAHQADQALIRVNTAAESIGQAADKIAQTIAGARPAIDSAGQALANVAGMTDPMARERQELRTMLNELSEAARSIRILSSYLEQHPETLIRGKGGSARR